MEIISVYKCKKDMCSIFNCKITIYSFPKNCIQECITSSHICQHIFLKNIFIDFQKLLHTISEIQNSIVLYSISYFDVAVVFYSLSQYFLSHYLLLHFQPYSKSRLYLVNNYLHFATPIYNLLHYRISISMQKR